MEGGPDGHRSNPGLWVELERRKCDAGYMQAWFIEQGQEVLGVVSTARDQQHQLLLL